MLRNAQESHKIALTSRDNVLIQFKLSLEEKISKAANKGYFSISVIVPPNVYEVREVREWLEKNGYSVVFNYNLLTINW